MKRITMYGRTFEVKRVGGGYGGYRELLSIYQAYDRPSPRKVAIYEDWVNFFNSNIKPLNRGLWHDFGIHSYNTCMFTFDYVLKTKKALLHFHITPAHNYLYIHEKHAFINC